MRGVDDRKGQVSLASNEFDWLRWKTLVMCLAFTQRGAVPGVGTQSQNCTNETIAPHCHFRNGLS